MINRLLGQLSITKKMMVMVLIPLFGFAVLAEQHFVDLYEAKTEAAYVKELMIISALAGNLIHETQKERGMSAGYINSEGSEFRELINGQRDAVDKRAQDLKDELNKVDLSHYGAAYVAAINKVLKDVDKINDIRARITALTIPLSEAVRFYSSMNQDILSISRRATFATQDAEVIRSVSAFVNFSSSKELVGIERAVGAAGFGGGWNDALRKRSSSLIEKQSLYMDVASTFMTEDNKKFIKQVTSGDAFTAVQEMRDIAQDPIASQHSSITGEEWFRTITKKINKLKEIEDYLSAFIVDRAHGIYDKSKSEMAFYALFILSVLLVICMIVYLCVRDLLKGMNSIKTTMTLLSNNDLDTHVHNTKRKDEIGSMARALLIFKDKLTENRKLEEAAKQAQIRSEQERAEFLSQISSRFDEQVGDLIVSLASAATQLQSTAENMRSIADQTSGASQNVAAASEEASVNVSTVAAAMEEMSATSNEISNQIRTTQNRSTDTENNAKGANQTVSDLSELVGNIGEVVGAIRDIAEQTNLLALNATIEAARAGEAGKGFAVVAEEVKKLAMETSTKTDEIEQRISEIQNATTNSVGAMEKIIDNIGDINESITAVVTAVEEQDNTCGEITRNITEASQGVQQVTGVILDVQRSSSETEASAEAVLGAAKEVTSLSNNLKDSIRRFLTSLDTTQKDA